MSDRTHWSDDTGIAPRLLERQPGLTYPSAEERPDPSLAIPIRLNLRIQWLSMKIIQESALDYQNFASAGRIA